MSGQKIHSYNSVKMSAQCQRIMRPSAYSCATLTMTVTWEVLTDKLNAWTDWKYRKPFMTFKTKNWHWGRSHQLWFFYVICFREAPAWNKQINGQTNGSARFVMRPIRTAE